MDFSKLSGNEKTATLAAAVVVLAGIISNWGGFVWLSVIAAAAAILVLLIPQWSPGASLPGSKGNLLVTLGGIAAAGMVIEILRFLGYFFDTLADIQTLLFALALLASLVLAWTGWVEFQREGGKFRIGSGSPSAAEATPAEPAQAPPPPPAPAMAAPAAPPPTAPPPAAPITGAPEATGAPAAGASAAEEDDEEGSAPVG